MKVIKKGEHYEIRIKNRKIKQNTFGKSVKSTSIQVDDKDLKEALKTYGKSMTFKIKVEGKTHNVYIQHVETRILKPQDIIHFDLRVVGAKERMSALIPVILLGKEVFFDSDMFIHEGLNEISAEYLPGHGISKIEIDVSEMKLDDIVLVKDLNVPSDVVLKADPEDVVLEIREVKLAPEETEEEEEGIEIEDEETEEEDEE